jgi:ATP-dependent Lhr-like helicase
MVPLRADRTILTALKKRLEETEISFVCTNCHNLWDSRVSRTTRRIKCSRCGAIKIAVFRRYNKDLAKILNKKDKSTEEKKEVARIHKNASLVLSYGYVAIMTLVARGIGPDTAARILRRYNRITLEKSDELMFKFLRDILNAELNYARTRGFWDK